MGRPPTIDRDEVLDLAEDILLKGGTGALTIDALAKAAGVSKGGIQSRFGTKNDLIASLMRRCEEEYEAEIRTIIGEAPTPVEAVRGHIRMTQNADTKSEARAASMMAALIEEREHLMTANCWYQSRFGRLDTRTSEGRRARLAFYAVEGAFILRTFGFATQADEDWEATMADILALLDDRL